jgi:hypothetical protein
VMLLLGRRVLTAPAAGGWGVSPEQSKHAGCTVTVPTCTLMLRVHSMVALAFARLLVCCCFGSGGARTGKVLLACSAVVHNRLALQILKFCTLSIACTWTATRSCCAAACVPWTCFMLCLLCTLF